MNNEVTSFGMTATAAISLSLLGAPTTTAVDETTKDNLTLLNPVEEQFKDTTTTDPSDETVVPTEDGIAIRRHSGCPVGYACI